MSSEKTASVPPLMNKMMKFILRSPLHRVLSKYLLLITFKGRKSGKTYTTPVSYSQEGDLITIFTHAHWWKNLLNNPEVTLHLKGRQVHGIASVVDKDKLIIATELVTHLSKAPFDARFYDVTFDEDGTPQADEVKKAVQTVVMIQVALPLENAELSSLQQLSRS